MGRGRGPSASAGMRRRKNGGTGEGQGQGGGSGASTSGDGGGATGSTSGPSGDAANTAAAAAALRVKLRGVRKKTGSAQLPSELKKCRACMICSLIKTEAEFQASGCDNCDGFLNLAGQKGSLKDYTSANFEGMVAMMEPEGSWVAKWQRLVELKPGIYAVNVVGRVDKWIEDEMEQAGVPYISRDKRAKDMEENVAPPESSPSRKRRGVTGTTNQELDSDEDTEASIAGDPDGTGNAPVVEDDAASVAGTAVSDAEANLKREVDENFLPEFPVEVELTVGQDQVAGEVGDDNDSVVQGGGSVVGICKPKGTDRYHPLFPKIKLPPASDISSACTYRSGKKYLSDSSGESDDGGDKENSDSDL